MKTLKTYSVYNKKTDMPVYIGGTVKQCAQAMGILEGSFRTIYSLIKTGKRGSNTWGIIPDEEVTP